jgi:prevent-host-death family protein
MVRTWPMEEARERLPEVLELARRGDVQILTEGQEETLVLLSYEEYKRLTQAKKTLWEALQGGPKFEDDELAQLFSRDPSLPREVDLGLDP